MSSTCHNEFTRKLDKTAVVLSGLCLIHCLALPLLLAVFPLVGFALVAHETFHQLILIVVVPTTVVALGTGCWRHHSVTVGVLGVAGITALAIAAFTVHALGAELLERAVTVAGGLLLAAAHMRNYQLSRHRHAVSAAPAVTDPGHEVSSR